MLGAVYSKYAVGVLLLLLSGQECSSVSTSFRGLWRHYFSCHDDCPTNKRIDFVLFLWFRSQVCRILAVVLLFAFLLPPRSSEALPYYLSSHNDCPQKIKRLKFVLFLEFRSEVCRVLPVALIFALLFSPEVF